MKERPRSHEVRYNQMDFIRKKERCFPHLFREDLLQCVQPLLDDLGARRGGAAGAVAAGRAIDGVPVCLRGLALYGGLGIVLGGIAQNARAFRLEGKMKKLFFDDVSKALIDVIVEG